jgi:hypothetical protein
MEKQACHRTALPSNQASPPPCQKTEEAAQQRKISFTAAKTQFFARGLRRVETRRSNDPQPNSALSFLRAAVDDQSRITLTTKHP